MIHIPSHQKEIFERCAKKLKIKVMEGAVNDNYIAYQVFAVQNEVWELSELFTTEKSKINNHKVLREIIKNA